ncbi:Secreted protein [Mycena sanguinolenta]|uniref:Secreted protein n=1 Tax=Mycena sanguinolenta TaxID=230812 RepID=A0A8H6YJ83_9AGAR|nr:Secreted protein [Mycena sanguinolenta]
MLGLQILLFAALCWPTHVKSLPGDLGSFASPNTGVKWRYWIEDASASPDIVQSDIAEIARVGSAGFELLSYQSYGGEADNTGNILLDPTDFAFGSDLFVNITSTVVSAAKENGLTVDFSMGPDQGAGVPVFPSSVDMEGMNTELVFGAHFLTAEENFSGTLPSPTVFPMVSGLDNQIDSANITTMRLVSAVVAELIPGANTSAARVSVDWNTVQELTSQVDDSFNVSFTAPNTSSVLLAYYSRRNGFPEARRGFNGSFLDEPGSWGSWVVDHFSPKGANVSISFITQNILSRDDIGAMITQPGVGRYMWEDSMEFFAQLFWTDALPQRFTERHGYEINKTLPVMHTLPNTGPKANQTFDFGTTVDSDKFLEDYQDTLTSLYMDYMSTFKTHWNSIGLEFSNQPAYNFRLDVAASAAVPDTPEIESLGVPTIDEARQLSGGVHLGNHTLFSSETGANFEESYSFRMAELLLDAKTQYAGGVNIALLHGFPYSGAYPGTTWPGITTFGFNFADMHGPRMPAWSSYKEYLDFLKRTQYVLQSGIAKVDVGIYRKDYNIIGSPPFQGNSLVNAGYTYEYVSPENLKLNGVSVSNGRLASGGPAYKAFILNRQSSITVDAAQRVLEYAQSGLPIVISGPVPNDIPGFDANGTQQAQVQALMQQLVNETNVMVVSNETQVPEALVSMSVLPAASVSAPLTTIYSVRRDVADASYFYLFNSGNTTENFTLTLRPDIVAGTPFFLDAFTAQVSPVALWTNDSGAISIPSVSLAPTQSALFAVSNADTFEGIGVPSSHLVALDSPALAAGNANGTIEVRAPSDGVFNYTLSTGQVGSVEVALGGEVTRTLDGWLLDIVAWTPPENLSTIESVLVPQPVFNLTQGLVPWNTLQGQVNTSGVGTYNTTFDWDSHNGTVGAELDFGSVFHTIKAFVNEVQIPTADPSFPIVDITQFVIDGANTIRVEAASTLLNALNAVPEVESLGFLRTQTGGVIPTNQAYGLVEPVQLIPYGRAVISV